MTENTAATMTENETEEWATVLTITRKSRNLSMGWCNSPTGRGTEISEPSAPREQGGIATLHRQIAECRRTNSGGNYHTTGLYVGGKRVIEVFYGGEWTPIRSMNTASGMPFSWLFDELEQWGDVTVEVE